MGTFRARIVKKTVWGRDDGALRVKAVCGDRAGDVKGDRTREERLAVSQKDGRRVPHEL